MIGPTDRVEEPDGPTDGDNGDATADTTDGLRVDTESTNNQIISNHMDDNLTHDCHDDSAGAGTAPPDAPTTGSAITAATVRGSSRWRAASHSVAQASPQLSRRRPSGHR